MSSAMAHLVAIQYSGSDPKGLIILPCEFEQDGDQWVAECLQLGTAVYASTFEKGREELGGAVLLQLNQIQQLGYIDEYLKEHGVRTLRLKPPKESAQSGSLWVEPTLVAV